MTHKTIISRTGSSTEKIHGYTIDCPNDRPAYHVIPYDKDTQKTVNARLKKILNKLIDDGEI